MTTLLLALALLAQAPPPDVESAVREYYVLLEHEAEQEAHRTPQDGAEGPSGAPGDPPGLTPLPGAPTRLLALIRPGGTTSLREVASGEPLVLLGENLPPGGTVKIARKEAVITRQTATFYEITAPLTTAALTGALDLFVGGVFRARLAGTFTVLPKQEPPPVASFPLLVSSYIDAAGRAVRAGEAAAVASGEVLTLVGGPFGTAKGRAWVGAVEVAVVAWSDTRVTVRLPVVSGAGGGRRMVLSLRMANGKHWRSMTWLVLEAKR